MNTRSMAGWINFAGLIMVLLGGINFFQGLIAVIEDDSGQTWARWATIVVAGLNLFAQLGFLGNSNYPLWALTAITLSIVVLYALIVRWDESQPQLQSQR